MFGIHRGYRRGGGSSSDEESSGSAHRPPAAGHRANRVRRALFGPTDPEENLRFVRQELKKHKEIQANRWNFDFELGRPMKGRLEWELVPKEQIHPAYNCSRLDYLRTHSENFSEDTSQPAASERHSMLGHSHLKTARTGSVHDLKTPSPVPGGGEAPSSVPCSTNLPPGLLPASRSVPASLHGLADDVGSQFAGTAGAASSTTSLSSAAGRPPLHPTAATSHAIMAGGVGRDQCDGPDGLWHDRGGGGGSVTPPRLTAGGRDTLPGDSLRPTTDPVIERATAIGASASRDFAAGRDVGLRSRTDYSPAMRDYRAGDASSRLTNDVVGHLSGARSEVGASLLRQQHPHHHHPSSTSQHQFKVPPASSVRHPGERGTERHPPPGTAGGSSSCQGADDQQQQQLQQQQQHGSSRGDHGGARPKTKDQKITEAFRSRKLSRSKSAGKLKRLGGGGSSAAAASRSPSVKSRQQSRSTLPAPR